MDISVLTAVILATISIVPGLWALINQINKNKREEKSNMFMIMENAAFEIVPSLQAEISKLEERASSLERMTGESSREQLFKKMYEKPVIIRCEHCASPNVITSFNCTQCGAPINNT